MDDSARWQQRFHAFVVNGFDVAADRPERVLVAGGGIEPHQLWAWDRSTGERRRLTDAPKGLLGGFLSADGEWAFYLDDPDGSEEGVLVRVPWSGGPPTVVDPSLPPGFLLSSAVHGDRVAFSLVVEGQCQHWITTIDGSAPARLLGEDAGESRASAFADGGRSLVIVRSRDDGNRETVVLDLATGATTATLAEPDVTLIAYTPSPIPGDPRMLAESSSTGRRLPFLWDRATDARTPLDVDGLDGNVRPLAWSPDGRTIVLLQIHAAEMRFHLVDVASGHRRPADTPPGALTGLPEVFATTFGADSEVLTVWQDGVHAPSILSIPTDGRPSSVVFGDDAPVAGVPWRNLVFAHADGTPLQGWLAVPEGEGPFPLVVDAHGGPFIDQFDWFQPHLQAFVDRGFAVVSVNYRGSGTFGDGFRDAIIGRAGRLETEDLAAAVDRLVADGIADPRRVLVEGWSYGGYLALMALSLDPGRWAGGICGVGIADTAGVHAQSSFVRDLMEHLHGGAPDAVPAAYAASSPITYADEVTAPLLVIHGRNDIRCPAPQMEAYLARMAELGKDVEAVWFDEGHLGGLTDPSVLLDHTGRMLAFAEKVVGAVPAPA